MNREEFLKLGEEMEKKGETIKPCEDTAVVFDGLRWHTAILPEPGTRRVTLVATFI